MFFLSVLHDQTSLEYLQQVRLEKYMAHFNIYLELSQEKQMLNKASM